MTTHTPGPWEIRKTDWVGNNALGRLYISGDRQQHFAVGVCIVEGCATSVDTTAANARLIATAPDYDAVVCKLVDFDDEIGSPAWNALLSEARAALSKAKGGEA